MILMTHSCSGFPTMESLTGNLKILLCYADISEDPAGSNRHLARLLTPFFLSDARLHTYFWLGGSVIGGL